MSKETILAKAIHVSPAPRGYKGEIIITAQAYLLGGNQHPHFSVTGEISTKRERERGDFQTGGCIHDHALKAWPAIAPIIALHLSNADDGEPMHAEGNGFYNLAGSVPGNFGEQYHRGNSKQNFPVTPPADKPWQDTEHRFPTEAECLAMLADLFRCSIAECEAIRAKCIAAANEAADREASSEEVTKVAQQYRQRAARIAAKNVFHDWTNTHRERWQAEAVAGIALIHRLAEERAERIAQQNATANA